jgi:hypothetical protein
MGYLGGRAATRMILEIVNPKMLQEQQRVHIADVQAALEQSIANAKVWPQ